MDAKGDRPRHGLTKKILEQLGAAAGIKLEYLRWSLVQSETAAHCDGCLSTVAKERSECGGRKKLS